MCFYLFVVRVIVIYVNISQTVCHNSSPGAFV